MRFVSSYIPPALCLILGIIFFDRFHAITQLLIWLILIGVAFIWRNWAVVIVCGVAAFQLGIFLRAHEESKTLIRQEQTKPYLNKSILIHGEVVSHPIPAKNSFSYVLSTSKIFINNEWVNETIRIQIKSKSFQSPEKGDLVELKTKIFVPSTLFEIQRIKDIQAFGTVYGDRQWRVLQTENAYSTRIRNHIFDAAKINLSPTSYGYYRAMVFGDQAFLSGPPMERLKDTGLLHLFVISGSHITYVWLIGFCLFRILLSWVGVFHRNKNFFLWIEAGSIFSVIIFLMLINPPISTYRAVGSMLLFLLLRLMRRYQHPLWNLGVVYCFTLLINPLFLFDISTQLTFGSVAGILCACEWMNRRDEVVERSYISKIIYQTVCVTLGATLFTMSILYLQLNTFNPISFVYNLLLVPTLGILVSVMSVLSLVWSLLSWDLLNQIMFSILDILYLWFEKILFWKMPTLEWFIGNSLDSGSLWLYWGLGGLLAGMAFIITRHLLKESSN